MPNFNGFTSSETFTQVPDSFIRLINEIDDVAELKVTLYAIWRIEHMEGNFRALCETDFEAESLGMGLNEIRIGLRKSIERGTLLKRRPERSSVEGSQHEADVFYFLNSPRGRLVAEAVANGQWRGSAKSMSAQLNKSNVFRLYEENFGALTPLLSDMLREAEKNYPSAWFEEAFEIAVSRNIRNWKYVEAILARWKEKGKDERKDQQDTVKDAKRYTDSDFSEFTNRD
ncbi:MAG: DnaD domain protein [Anaerolineales bacterium]|nr:DnaD domain protein [Anaerolineales bacterium]